MTMGVLTPAYGRRYLTSDEAEDAYFRGDDFVFHNPASRWDGKYCSCRDFKGQSVEIRYGKRNEKALIVLWKE